MKNSERNVKDPDVAGRVWRGNLTLEFRPSTSNSVLRKLNAFETGLRREIPQIPTPVVSIATAQLLLDMQRARLRYEQFLENARMCATPPSLEGAS